MQASMWLVLAGTLGLAGWFTHYRTSAGRPTLAEARQAGTLSVRLPAKWQISTGTAPVVLQATEQLADEPGRTITVVRERTSALMSAREYLDRTNIQYVPIDPRRLSLPVTVGPIDFAGWPGFFFVGARDLRNTASESDEPASPQIGLFACAVLPSQQAITVSLESRGRLDEADKDLLMQVIDSIKLTEEHSATMTGPVALPDGGSFALPNGFDVLPNKDAHRRSVRLLARDARQWATMEIIPCLLPTIDSGSVLAMLSLHDINWLSARVQQVTADTWRVDASDTRDFAQFALKAYVKTDGKGAGVLAIGRAQDENPAPLERAWQTIQQGLVFGKAQDLPGMFKAGADQVAAFRAAGLGKLLAGQRAERWWIWSDDSPDPFIGWSHESFDDSSPWLLQREARWRAPDRHLARITQKWDSSADFANVSYEVRRDDARASVDDSLKPTLAQKSLLADAGRLDTRITARGTVVGTETLAPGPEFLPGAWLMLLLGRSGDRPMILSTESLPGFEGLVTPRPVLVRVEPSTDAVRSDESGVLRCLSVQVNGVGQLQRWYFRGDGRLQYLALPNSQHREPTTREQVKFNLGEDPRLMP